MAAERLIGVDWGGSSLRVFLFDDDGGVVERRSSHRGVATIEAGGFADVLGELIADWASGGARLVMCGMIGSRQGWAEAPYIACPTDLQALAGGLLPLETPFGPALIAPGLSVDDHGRLDVMRGEETQFLGAMPQADWSGVIIHPGTHAKWAWFDGGRITRFRTWMTGELFAVLREHSVLRLLMTEGPHDDAAFELGVRASLQRSGNHQPAVHGAHRGSVRAYRAAGPAVLSLGAPDRRRGGGRSAHDRQFRAAPAGGGRQADRPLPPRPRRSPAGRTATSSTARRP